MIPSFGPGPRKERVSAPELFLPAMTEATDTLEVEQAFFESPRETAGVDAEPAHDFHDSVRAPLPPELAKRQRRLRKLVAAILGVMTVASFGVVARLAVRRANASVFADPVFHHEVVPSIQGFLDTEPSREADPVSAPAEGPSKMRAREAIERGAFVDGVALSQGAIDADPTDAEGYLLLGAALQETGRWNEAKLVFANCIRRAERGPTVECAALGR